MNRDPLASLRCRPVDVELAGWVYRIAALPAADWIEATLAGDWGVVFPGLLRDAGLERDAWGALLRGQIGPEDVRAAAWRALTAAAGRPWWVAQRLVGAATHERQGGAVVGALVRAGFDFERQPFGAFLDAVYSFAIEGANEDQRLKLNMELNTPPPEVDADEWYSDEEAEADFLAALGDTGS